MDAGHWDLHHLHSGSHRKRPWDVDTTSTKASVVGSGYSNQLGRDAPVELDWKRRRNTSQANTSTWETSVKTSLWLAQQDNMSARAEADKEDTNHYRRTIDFQQVPPRDEPLSSMPSWPRHPEGVSMPQSQEGQDPHRQALVGPASSCKFMWPKGVLTY